MKEIMNTERAEQGTEDTGCLFMNAEERDSMHMWIMRLTHCYMSMGYCRFMEMGIHPGQLPVLHAVGLKEGMTQKELARELHIKPPTVTVTVSRMEKAGLLCRKEDKKDRRICRLYLTERGKKMGTEIQDLVKENEQILMKDFSEQELVQMKGYFERIIQNIHAVTNNTDAVR